MGAVRALPGLTPGRTKGTVVTSFGQMRLPWACLQSHLGGHMDMGGCSPLFRRRQARLSAGADPDAFARREIPDGLAWRRMWGMVMCPGNIRAPVGQSGAESIVKAANPHHELHGMLVGSRAGKVVWDAGIPVMVLR